MNSDATNYLTTYISKIPDELRNHAWPPLPR